MIGLSSLDYSSTRRCHACVGPKSEGKDASTTLDDYIDVGLGSIIMTNNEQSCCVCVMNDVERGGVGMEVRGGAERKNCLLLGAGMKQTSPPFRTVDRG
jgi:hypothetical protein